MYQAPDVIKVKVNVEDVFASYHPTGCPMGGMTVYDDVVPDGASYGCNDRFVEYATFISWDWGDSCYTSYLP